MSSGYVATTRQDLWQCSEAVAAATAAAIALVDGEQGGGPEMGRCLAFVQGHGVEADGQQRRS